MMNFSKSELNVIEFHKRKDIISIYGSVNDSSLSLKDKVAQKAKAYICTFRSDSGQYELGVIFDFLGVQDNVQFTSVLPIAQENLSLCETQALDFVERLGFMMANLEVGKLNHEEREKYFNVLSFFEKAVPVKSASPLVSEQPIESPATSSAFEDIKKEMHLAAAKAFEGSEPTALLSAAEQKIAQKVLVGF